MEKYKEVIPIFFAVDDGYIPFLAVTLQSIVEKSKNLKENTKQMLNVKNESVTSLKTLSKQNVESVDSINLIKDKV